jgi:ABC-type glycerol-3-phosphate transport system permease component
MDDCINACKPRGQRIAETTARYVLLVLVGVVLLFPAWWLLVSGFLQNHALLCLRPSCFP